MKKKESKNCNVSRLRCQCNHRRCRQPLAASSFTRSPRPPLLRSRRSITSFTQHSALGAGTQLDAEPAPPSHTPAETQSRTSRSFFLHTIPATLSSALAASASRCSHTPSWRFARTPADSSATPPTPPSHTPRQIPVANESSATPDSGVFSNQRGRQPFSYSQKQGIYNPGIIFHHLSVALSLHGACRRNTAPRETHAHNTPHATPSTDKSCTSRTANIPHSTAPAPVGRHPSSTLSSPHHWLIHLSKARCVQSLPPRQCKARAHTIPHADAEKRSWHRRV